MKFTLIISLAVIANVLGAIVVFSNIEETELVNPKIYALFTQWKKENNKTYSDVEHDRRIKIFAQNYGRIEKINSLKRNFTVGLNQFADLSKDEFRSLFLGLKTNNFKKIKNSVVEFVKVGSESIDWRTKNAVNSVQNQGQCSSGWAFSATAALEGFAAIQKGKLNIFSEQQLIDCSRGYGNQGCKGGSMLNALMYTAAHGIELESSYQYTGTDDACKYDIDKREFKNGGYQTANSDAALQKAVAQGPVSISVEADEDVFQYYTEGVLDSADCGTQLNHAVLAVGYDVVNGSGYWIMKNSWGQSWGDQGYLKIARASGDGICGVNIDNVFPSTWEPDEGPEL